MMKKNTGFTVIELLLVIGLIGILIAVMLGSMSGSSNSARASRCLANLHNLSSACQAFAIANTDHHYPLAGSREGKWRGSGGNTSYYESKGWVSWASMGNYRGATAHKSSSGWFISTYETDSDKRTYALTNGAIWQAISGNASAFVCPSHTKYAQRKKVVPIWSYVMNSYFGWDDSLGTTEKRGGGISFETLQKGDRRLFFAELPFNTDNTAQTCDFSTSAGTRLDPTLQYPEDQTSYDEVIGFNHKDGKKWYAHVCFADGHTEKLELPTGANADQVRKLTKWLCEAKDVSYNGKQYEELE